MFKKNLEYISILLERAHRVTCLSVARLGDYATVFTPVSSILRDIRISQGLISVPVENMPVIAHVVPLQLTF